MSGALDDTAIVSTQVLSVVDAIVDFEFVLDSVSFRPVLAGPRGSPQTEGAATDFVVKESDVRRLAVVTSFQGSRYRPETVRALAGDPQALATMAGSLASAAAALSSRGIVIDLQGMTSKDLQEVIDVIRAVADSAAVYSLGPIAFVVPPGDTAGYPAAVIGRAANLIVARLYAEHHPGTAPGPIASPSWFIRQLGMRTAEVGSSRIVAEIPLFGYRWDRNGTARRITFAEARAEAVAGAVTLARDPASRSLHASSAIGGWEIWVPDRETVETLIAAARRLGVRRFALNGVSGADPDIWTGLSTTVRR